MTLDEVEREVAIQLVITADEEPRVGLESQLSAAKRNLESWNSVDVNAPRSSQSLNALLHERPPYGARGWSEVLRRVQKRARALIRIFDEAILHQVQIRFFSVDLARELDGRHWESSGQSGVVTIANALEAPHALAVQIPAGIPYAFALTHLTVQNRRALCTLLWTKKAMPSPSVLIWSDTDGQWLCSARRRGFAEVTAKLLACSAPHHASANDAHNEVWVEISAAPADLIVLSAGGQANQRVRAEYNAKKKNRCCTWCRAVANQYQEVSISFESDARLQQACIGRH
ncbi:hypothetical protein SK224_05280 [Microbacterium sp. BG28]|uniref:hypothetical protein n=1 Tax=Microbacterium sp. BG28 TaxID=3097356 RepID=UPI002A59D5F7|nr:hypothetical protein [Microbacterium sp. BG28]MDY0828537.1 hypothetical protein [Microbacterium sp. BG28]